MKIELIILGIIALSGIAGILDQLVTGFKKTNLNDKYVWGIYIQGCFFLSSVAAGTLMIIASMLLFRIEGLENLLQIGNTIAFSLLLGAQVLLGLDLGKPARAVYMMASRNFRSPLTWDFYTLGLSTLLSIVFLVGILPSNSALTGIWALLVLAAGSLCISAHTMFFLSRVKGGYQTNSFLGLETLLYSFSGGAAVLSIAGAFSGVRNPFPQLLLILTVFLMVTIAGHKIAQLTQDKEHKGKTVPALHVLSLISLLGYEFADISPLVLAASGLSLIAVFAEKYHIVVQSQSVSMIPEPYSQFQDKRSYKPSFKEWNVLIGGCAVCALISYGIIYLKAGL